MPIPRIAINTIIAAASLASSTLHGEPDQASPAAHLAEIEKFATDVLDAMNDEDSGDDEQRPAFTPNPDAFRLAVRPDGKPLVIAHRGASGYLPEHTLAAYAAAYFMGADVIEPDVVLTKDGVPICSHDITLDETTDVAEKFPGRARDDGKHYAIDFTFAEIKTLEKLGREGRVRMHGHTIPTLSEMIELVQSLNASFNKTVGIIPEAKQPAFHRSEGQPIEAPLVTALAAYGYADRDDACVIQCFDLEALATIRHDLNCNLPLAFVFGDEPTRATLDRAAEFCDAFGPNFKAFTESPTLMSLFASGGDLDRFGLYPWTFGDDIKAMNKAFSLGMAGLFTDFPDIGLRARQIVNMTPEEVESTFPNLLEVLNGD